MKESMKKFSEFCEANPETSAEAFMISKGDFELYCRIMDFACHIFMRADIAYMSRETEDLREMNKYLDELTNFELEPDLINLESNEFEKDLFMAEHDMKTDEPYEFAAMKEEAAKLETKRKIDEHPISKLFAELLGKNMGVWL